MLVLRSPHRRNAVTPLTARQNAVYEFIRSTLRDANRAPSLTEIGAAVGIASTNGVSKHLHALEEKGYIRRPPGKARAIEVVGEAAAASTERRWSVPVLGTVSSRYPDRLRHRPPRYVSVDELLVRGAKREACVAMRAADDGVARMGIVAGDLVVVEEVPVRTLDHRTLAGVLYDDMPAVRYVRYDHGVFQVHGLGPSGRPDTFRRGDPAFHVVGRVVATLRVYPSPDELRR